MRRQNRLPSLRMCRYSSLTAKSAVSNSDRSFNIPTVQHPHPQHPPCINCASSYRHANATPDRVATQFATEDSVPRTRLRAQTFQRAHAQSADIATLISCDCSPPQQCPVSCTGAPPPARNDSLAAQFDPNPAHPSPFSLASLRRGQHFV